MTELKPEDGPTTHVGSPRLPSPGLTSGCLLGLIRLECQRCPPGVGESQDRHTGTGEVGGGLHRGPTPREEEATPM